MAIPTDQKILQDVARQLIEGMNVHVSKPFADSVALVGEGMVHTTVHPTGCVAFRTIDKGIYMATSDELGMTVKEYDHPSLKWVDGTEAGHAVQMALEAAIARQLREQYEPALAEAIRLTARGNHGDHGG